MNKRKLPLGNPTFREIRESDSYYVDKTGLLNQVVSLSKYCFLSRPRRFGKSLLVDTLRELFRGNEPLFRGLAIHNLWNWEDEYPVIRFSFDGYYGESGKLAEDIGSQLTIIEQDFKLENSAQTDNVTVRLRSLLHRLSNEAGNPVVVLIDEYDRPILDVIEDPALAKENRDYLRGFYATLKGSSEYIRFVFITGITACPSGSLFSGLNVLTDISLDPRFASICGFTDAELDSEFEPELADFDRESIRRWYNGYSWLGTESVYNPFGLVEFFNSRKFNSHWYRSATPNYLFQLIVNGRFNPLMLENLEIDESLLSTFDVDQIDLRALMFQSGYLTISQEVVENHQITFKMTYPNQEVRQSFNRDLLVYLKQDNQVTRSNANLLLGYLAENDFDKFSRHLQGYLAQVPHQWYDSSNLGQYESHYALMMLMTFNAVAADVRVEDASSKGRADMVLIHANQVFIFEFKLKDSSQSTERDLNQAITQIRDRGYASKYRHHSMKIHLIAVVFDEDVRSLLEIRTEGAEKG